MNALECLQIITTEPLIAEKLPKDLLNKARSVDVKDTAGLVAVTNQLLEALEQIIPTLSEEETAAFERLETDLDVMKGDVQEQGKIVGNLSQRTNELQGNVSKFQENLDEAKKLI